MRCELDDGWRDVEVALPAVLSTAERLTEPCKVDPAGRAAVDVTRIRRLTASDLGPGPWGDAGSPTAVGDVRTLDVARRRVVLSGDVAVQVDRAVELLRAWGAVDALHHWSWRGSAAPEADGSAAPDDDAVPVPGPAVAGSAAAPMVAVVIEPDRPRVARELLGEAVHLAPLRVGGGWWPSGRDRPTPRARVVGSGSGAVAVTGTTVEEDVARAVTDWCVVSPPWAVLVPGTLWGREVAARHRNAP